MKRYIKTVSLAVSVFLVSCNNEADRPGKTDGHSGAAKRITDKNNGSSEVDYAKSGYQGQLQYLNGGFGDINDFKVKNELDKKIADSGYSWAAFDAMYNDGLNKAQKQYLAYLVLSKKDLLSEFNENPTEAGAAAILKYSNVLAETDYFGYCLLYNCISALKSQKFVPADIDQMKRRILGNENARQFHEGSIKHLTAYTGDPHSAEVLKKITEDLGYLEKIKDI